MLNIYDIINKKTHNGNDNFTAYSRISKFNTRII